MAVMLGILLVLAIHPGIAGQEKVTKLVYGGTRIYNNNTSSIDLGEDRGFSQVHLFYLYLSHAGLTTNIPQFRNTSIWTSVRATTSAI